MREHVIVELIKVCQGCKTRPWDVSDAGKVEAIDGEADGVREETREDESYGLRQI
jgi:hypothetical protein